MHMKHFILSAAAVFGVALSLSAADGDTFSWQGLNYRVLSETEKTCEVGDNVSASGAVVIPEKASNGSTDYTVTALGEDAFYLNVNMTSISIPETVTTIGSQALSRCIGLTDLVLPNSVKEIGTRAAYACNYLEAPGPAPRQSGWSRCPPGRKRRTSGPAGSPTCRCRCPGCRQSG